MLRIHVEVVVLCCLVLDSFASVLSLDAVVHLCTESQLRKRDLCALLLVFLAATIGVVLSPALHDKRIDL